MGVTGAHEIWAGNVVGPGRWRWPSKIRVKDDPCRRNRSCVRSSGGSPILRPRGGSQPQVRGGFSLPSLAVCAAQSTVRIPQGIPCPSCPCVPAQPLPSPLFSSPSETAGAKSIMARNQIANAERTWIRVRNTTRDGGAKRILDRTCWLVTGRERVHASFGSQGQNEQREAT
jgi:hypothetical protein